MYHIHNDIIYLQYDKYEDQKGGQDSDMNTQALLIWPTLHSIAEPFKLQADTMGVHLRWADDMYTEFFPEYTRDDTLLLNQYQTMGSVSHRERIYSADDESFLDMNRSHKPMNHSHKPGFPEGLDLLDEFSGAEIAGRSKIVTGGGSNLDGLSGNDCP